MSPGAELIPRNDDWSADPNFLKGGTTVWLGRCDENERWEGAAGDVTTV